MIAAQFMRLPSDVRRHALSAQSWCIKAWVSGSERTDAYGRHDRHDGFVSEFDRSRAVRMVGQRGKMCVKERMIFLGGFAKVTVWGLGWMGARCMLAWDQRSVKTIEWFTELDCAWALREHIGESRCIFVEEAMVSWKLWPIKGCEVHGPTRRTYQWDNPFWEKYDRSGAISLSERKADLRRRLGLIQRSRPCGASPWVTGGALKRISPTPAYACISTCVHDSVYVCVYVYVYVYDVPSSVYMYVFAFCIFHACIHLRIHAFMVWDQ
jgi:hypothetical protein